MIINAERDPSISLYYLGSVVLKSLIKEENCALDELYALVQKDLGNDLHIDFFYYTLDWLFILSAIKLEGGSVSLCELKD